MKDNDACEFQAMEFLALANVLYDGVVWNTFAQDKTVQKGLAVLKPAEQEALLYGDAGQSCFCGIPRTERPKPETAVPAAV